MFRIGWLDHPEFDPDGESFGALADHVYKFNSRMQLSAGYQTGLMIRRSTGGGGRIHCAQPTSNLRPWTDYLTATPTFTPTHKSKPHSSTGFPHPIPPDIYFHVYADGYACQYRPINPYRHTTSQPSCRCSCRLCGLVLSASSDETFIALGARRFQNRIQMNLADELQGHKIWEAQVVELGQLPLANTPEFRAWKDSYSSNLKTES